IYKYKGHAQATIEIQASTNTVNLGSEELGVRCSPSGNGVNFISRIEILQQSVTESSFSSILYVEDPPRGSDPVFRNSDLSSRATAEGRAGRPSGAFLALTITRGRVNCNDGGSYKCRLTYTNGTNHSSTVTSSSSRVNLLAEPDSTPPTLTLSPSNIPGTSGNIYLTGTTITVTCQTEVGSPANLIRLCYRSAGITASQTVTNILANVVSPVSQEPSKSCVMTRTVVASFLVTNTAGSFSCEVYNDTRNAQCGQYIKTGGAAYTAQEYPVCNVSTTSTTQKPEVTTTVGAIIEGDNGALAVTDSGGTTLLILGCGLITLSGSLFAASVIICMKARKLRKDAEMTMIQSTYDSVHFQATPTQQYTSLDSLKATNHRPLEKLDSDGYMVPSLENYT
ncbi:uncharacterized protein LOC125651283, partial [Ostrea edulis]|uniref:uncharacterized protein LOC125651283 n=1 Tax=Ostrea edulis TaxID=37623 RepID=UPI0024AFC33F